MALTEEAIKILKAPVPKEEIKSKKIQGNVIRFTDIQFVEDRLEQADPSFEKEVTVSDKAVSVHYTVLGVRRGGSADIVDVKSYGSPVKNAEAQAAKRAAARFGVAAELWDKDDDNGSSDDDPRPRDTGNVSFRTNQTSRSNQSQQYGNRDNRSSGQGGSGPSQAQINYLTGDTLQVPESVAKQLTGGRDGTASQLITILKKVQRDNADEYEDHPMPFIAEALHDVLSEKEYRRLAGLLEDDVDEE